MSIAEDEPNLKVDDDRFPSLSSLRLAHSELLKLHREQGNQPDILTQIEQFMLKGRSIGAVLDNEDDRWAAQSILDYWSSLLYRAGQEPPDTTLVDFDPSLAPNLSDDHCPYMGLEAFRAQNQQLFFGRQRLVDRLLNHLKTNRLLVVVGSSGSGKSSVVLGGLLPRLQAGALPNSQDWIYYEPLVPGSSPLTVLARRLHPFKIATTEWIAQQVTAFEQNPAHLVQLVQQVGQPAVLVVDQFEEVFTLCQDDEIRHAFINNLLNFVETEQARNILILTMRTDFESYVARIPTLWKKFEQSSVRVAPLDASELREAIEKPAELVGLKFEPGLVDKLLNDVLGEPAALPLLQFTLLKLWDHREHNRVVWDAYQRLGSGRLALSRSADEFYNNLIPEEQLTVKRILLRMVRPGEGLEVTSNRIPRKELYRKGEAIDRVDRVLDKLVAARLVRLTDKDVSEDAQVEVAHEALIRNWSRLVDWLEDERITLRQRLNLRRNAEQWQVQGKNRSWLLRGSALQEALGYEDLNELETQFLQCSRQDENRRKFRSQLATSVIIALTLSSAALAIGVAWFADKSRQNTEIQSLSLSANNRWLSSRQIEALIEALNAVQQAEDYGKAIKPETKLQAIATLQQIISQIHEHNRLEGHLDAVGAVQFSPDGETLASASDYGIIKLWNRNGKPLATFQGHQDSSITAVQFSPDGQTLASASSDRTVKLWKLNGKLLTTLRGHTGRVRAVQFSPDGQSLASASDDKTVKLWNLNGELIATLQSHTGRVQAVQFSSNGQTLTSADDGRTVKVWKRNGELIATPQGHPDPFPVLAVQLSPDGQQLASVGLDKTVKVWKLNGELIATLKGHQGPVSALQFSPDGQTLASASFDRTVRLWAVQNSNQKITILEDNQDEVEGRQSHETLRMQFSSDGQRLASVGNDNTVKLWTSDGRLIATLHGHTAMVRAVQFSPDGQTFASASFDGTVKLWTRDGKPITTLQGHQNPVWTVQFSPDSQILASASLDGTVKLWTRAGKLIAPLQDHRGPVLDVDFSSDGNILASASSDGTVKLWTRDGKPITTLQDHQGQVWAVQFSPDGKILASASDDKTIKLWTRDGKPITTLQGHRDPVAVIQFSPDGQTLVSVSLITMKLWKRNGELISTLQGHQGKVLDVKFSPDGKILASHSEDKTIKLWNSDNGELLATLEGSQTSVLATKYLDQQTLLSASSDNTIRLWDFNAQFLGNQSCQWLNDYFSINFDSNNRIHEQSEQLCP